MKNKDLQYAVGISLILFGCILAVAGLGGIGASFVIRVNSGTTDVGIAPLDFMANHFRAVCAFQIPVGILMALFGRLFIHRRSGGTFL